MVGSGLALLSCSLAAPDPGELEARSTPGAGLPAVAEQAAIADASGDALPELPTLREPPRGLGSMTARLPGTTEVVGGVHLALHEVRVTIENGIAHTEVVEEFHNDTGRVLEGRLVFPLPADATLARLALWVEDELIEGEVVERRRADRIFTGIVDDTVRPRDPALLDMLAGGKVSLRIFPIPAHRSRKVLFAYDQVLRRDQDTMRYVYPLSFGSDRPAPVDRLEVTINGEPRLRLRNAVNVEDVVEVVAEEPPSLLVAAPARGDAASDTAVLVRTLAMPMGDERTPGRDVVIALDVSAAQSAATLAAQIHLADTVLSDLADDESFALLACDAACASYPPRGRAAATPAARVAARRFLIGLEPAGPADPAGALAAAAARLEKNAAGQVLLLSEGTATAGELSVESQLDHVRPLLAGADVRVIGVGRAVDDRSLAALARGLGATYDRFATGAPLAERARVLAASRRAAVVRAPEIDLPVALRDLQPAETPPTRVGEEVVVLARLDETPSSDESVVSSRAPIARLWAREQIAQLETRGREADPEITALAIRHHLLARTTSLLVLENDRMFAEFGIPRTPAPAALEDGAGAGDALGLYRHASQPPKVRMGACMVSGRLPPETVQRIVRLNHGRVRACYQKALLRDRSLAGRITTGFVIDRSGAVGRVTNESSEIADEELVKCVTRAFYALSFPQPEGGVVRVSYPIVFAPADAGDGAEAGEKREPEPVKFAWPNVAGRRAHGSLLVGPLLPYNSSLNPPPWVPPPVEPPSAVHRAGDDAWLAAASAPAQSRHVSAAQARVRRDPARRLGHQELIRALLVSGRVDEAHTAALALVELDPDFAIGRELLADTAAATGRSTDAARAMAAASTLDHRSIARQLAAARAASAIGDQTRACAHLRALGDLAPAEHGERAAACRAGDEPAMPDPRAHGFEVRVSCDNAACAADPPSAVVISPFGRVISPWTSGAGAPDFATGALAAGTYRTLVVGGGRRGAVSVRALGSTFTAQLGSDERRTAVVSVLTFPERRYRRRPVVRF